MVISFGKIKFFKSCQKFDFQRLLWTEFCFPMPDTKCIPNNSEFYLDSKIAIKNQAKNFGVKSLWRFEVMSVYITSVYANGANGLKLISLN